MTVCCALETPTGVWLGSDSWFGSQHLRDAVDRPKFVRNGALWFAWSNHWRAGQLIEHVARFRAPRRGEGDEAYLTRVVAGELERLFAGHKTQKGEPLEYEVLVVHRGRVYELLYNYGIARSPYGYAAVGAGTCHALAALGVLDRVAPEQRLRRALAITARHCPQVDPPFHVRFVPHASHARAPAAP